ncbi:hypothetical protein D3C80_2235290 [compost metagenome]
MIGVRSAISGIGKVEFPIRAEPVCTIFADQHLAGSQLENIAKSRAWRDRSPEGENLIERERI